MKILKSQHKRFTHNCDVREKSRIQADSDHGAFVVDRSDELVVSIENVVLDLLFDRVLNANNWC